MDAARGAIKRPRASGRAWRTFRLALARNLDSEATAANDEETGYDDDEDYDDYDYYNYY